MKGEETFFLIDSKEEQVLRESNDDTLKERRFISVSPVNINNKKGRERPY